MIKTREFVSEALHILEMKDEAREELLKITRKIARMARRTILGIHAGDLEQARTMVKTMSKLVADLSSFREVHPDLYYSGSVTGALAEYVEASMLFEYFSSGCMPSMRDLDVGPAPYLLGLADLVGELRRFTLRLIKEDKHREAVEVLSSMEEIYNSLMAVVLPEALVPGLRRKIDVIRGILEATRKDLLFYERSSALIKELERVFPHKG